MRLCPGKSSLVVVATDIELAWAAGLFAGEGNVGVSISRRTSNGPGLYEYLCVQIGMYDQRAISRFASTFGINYQTQHLKNREHLFYKIMARGRSAERILASMWPWLKHTDKGDQALWFARYLDIEEWITGQQTGDRPQRQNRKRGK